tara:strand:+ start:1815 stop:2465 length:651 start_codon:yes stop_codon:yes gene_type:complete
MKATLNVPTTLDEITLEQYQLYLAAQEGKDDEHYLQRKSIEIFCSVSEKDVKKIVAKDVRKISEKIAEMFEGEHELLRSFRMNGIDYGFVPNLDEISFGEYVDLDTYVSDWKNMHLSMNVLYRPITHRSAGRYEINSYETDKPEHALQMPMSAVLGSLFFLFNLGKDLLMTTQNYLKEEVEKQQVPSANLDKSLVGMAAYLDLAKETLLNLKLSHK